MKCTQAIGTWLASGVVVLLTLAGCTGGSGGGSGNTGHGGGEQADFEVTSIEINPATLYPGKTGTASVVVYNKGNTTTNAGVLGIWINQPDAQGCGATPDQTWVLAPLGAGQSAGHTFTFVAPNSGAPWTFRAFANADCSIPESDTSNNQLSKTYGQTEETPDFAIHSVVFNSGAVITDTTFTVTVTVTNLGGASGAPGYLDVWVNQPNAQACGAVGDDYVYLGLLGARESVSQDFTLTTPGLMVSNWTFRAFVDSGCDTDELDEGNNQYAILYGGVLGTPYRLAITDQVSTWWGSTHYADYYRLIPAATGSVTLNMIGSFDTFLILYDSNWNYLTYDDDSGDNLNARLTYNLTAGQTYYVEATSWAANVFGTYTLTTSSGTLTPVVRP